MRTLTVRRLGRVPYGDALAMQRALVEDRRADRVGDLLLLVEHPHVHEVAVVGVEDAQWGHSIVAVVVPAAGVDPDPDELREHVRKFLRGSRTPDRVVFRDELPTNATGKLLRREIVRSLRDVTVEK